MSRREFKSINVTIPYKKDVIPYLDELDENVPDINIGVPLILKNIKINKIVKAKIFMLYYSPYLLHLTLPPASISPDTLPQVTEPPASISPLTSPLTSQLPPQSILPELP